MPDTKDAAAPSKSPVQELLEKQPLLAALVALAVLELVPVLGLLASAEEGWDAWTTPAVILALAALLPPIGIALRRPWGLGAAVYVCWFGVAVVVLRAMTLGLSPLRVVPAAVYAGVLAALPSANRKPADAQKTPPPDLPLAAWAKENVEAIVVAFIMALVIRCFGIEVFKIPSSSMEPTLLGDVTVERSPEETRLYHGRRCDFEPYHRVSGTSSGDRIMVTKFFYALADIQRYDVVVFKFPLNQSRNFIKRVVGLPDEELLLYHGNVFARRSGDAEFRIARRPLRTQDALWINPADARASLRRWEDFERAWEVETGPKPTVLDGQLALDTAAPGEGTSIRHIGNLRDPEGQEVSDLRLQFDLTPTSEQGEVFAEIVNAYGRFELRLSTSADGALNWYKTHERGKQAALTVPAGARLELGQRTRVELAVYDGLAYARVNGASPKIEFITTRRAMDPLLSGEPAIRFGARGATFVMRDLEVGRDVHYKAGSRTGRFAEDEPVKVEPGEYVVMGDNVTSSHDSRGWVKKGYKLKGLDEPVEYEGQQEFEKGVDVASIQARYGLKVTPSEIVADKYGRIWALYAKGTDPGPLPPHVPAGVIEEPLRQEDFHGIGENFIVGKALWIWWPPGRWFNLIR